MTQLRFIKQILYQLQKDYGIKGCALYKITGSTNNIETGRAVLTRTKHKIEKIISLPQSYLTSKIYALSYIAANKNFTYGAFFNKNSRVFLIEKTGLEVAPENYLVIDHKRFDVKHTEDTEFDVATIIIAEAIDSLPPYEIHEISIEQRIRFVHIGLGEL